jgi:hypothetical protein
MAENHDFFEETVKKRHAPKTRETYESHLNQWKIHIYNRHREYWNDETGKLIRLPLPIEVLKSFFRENCLHPNGKLKSESAVNGYKSAIKSLYRSEKKISEWSQETEDELESFLDGYKTRVADAKLEGTMKQHEGKMPHGIRSLHG